MKIRVEFDSLEEFLTNLRTGEGFEPITAKSSFEEAQEKVKALAAETHEETQEAPEGFEPTDTAPFTEETKQETAPAVTEEFRVEVRKFLAKLNKTTGKNTASELIKTFGVNKLTEVPLADLPALMQEAQEAYDAV